jgi:hypothetical protein
VVGYINTTNEQTESDKQYFIRQHNKSVITILIIGSNNNSNIPTTYTVLLLVYSLQKLLRILVTLIFELELSCIPLYQIIITEKPVLNETCT